jgi:hypothetical protein
MADKSKKDDAQAQFAKLQRANDAKQAMSEYEADAEALRSRTAQLRALRLARDADVAAAAAAAPPKKKPAAKAAGKKKAAASSSLSEWLETETKSGRRG